MKKLYLIWMIFLYSHPSFAGVLDNTCWSIKNRISDATILGNLEFILDRKIIKNSETGSEEIDSIHLMSKESRKLSSIHFLNLHGSKKHISRITSVFLDSSLGHPVYLTRIVKDFLVNMRSRRIIEIQIPEDTYHEDLITLKRSHLAFYFLQEAGLKFLKKDLRQEITGGEAPTVQYFLQFSRG